jgi:predicted NBD/HSP70 family sugar kinase
MKSDRDALQGAENAARPRRVSRAAVLAFARSEKLTTQTEICAALDLSPATATRIVGDLMAEGLLVQDGVQKSGGGRPRAQLRFVGTRHAVIGIEAGHKGFVGAVSDLNGAILTERFVPAGGSGPENLEFLTRLIADLISVPRPESQTIVGIGVGVPSIVERPSGTVVLTLGLDWHDLPLQAVLAERFGLHVMVENDRNLAALGEFGFGAAQGAQSVVSLAIGPGAGAGIVVDGELLPGRSNASGEISWFLDDPAMSGRQFRHLGDKTQLRFSGISDDVIEALAGIAARHATGSGPTDPLPPEVAELLDFTTMAVAMLGATLNPEIIVLSGGIARGGDFVLQTLRTRLDGAIYEVPRLAMTDLGARNIVFGAIRAVLEATVLKGL